MRIAKLTIKNILGTEELEFSAGKWVYISGPNGSGKSTILEAIKAVFKGGHDATLLRDGADKGEIVLELDDGTELTKTIRPGTSDLKARRKGESRPLPKPAELVKALVDKLSNNPIEFLAAKEDDRVNIFLESMPIRIDFEKLATISGIKLPAAASDMHAFQVIEHVRQTVFDDRTGTNRAVHEKEHTIKQLREAMPDQPNGVIGGETELEAQLVQIDAKKDADLTEVHSKLSTFTDQVNAQIAATTTQHDQNIQHYADGIDAEIAALQAQIDAKRSEKSAGLEGLRKAKAEAIDAMQKRIAGVTERANAKRQEIKDAHQASRTPVETQLAVLRTNRDMAARRAQTLEIIANHEKELEGLKADSKRQTKALDAIDDYKSEVLKNLPIPGLEVRSGKIYRNNVVFDRLNMAQRVQIAVEIAKLRAGELGVICVDGIEALDTATLTEFHNQAGQTDLQFFVSHVSDRPFSIETDAPNF